MRIFYFLMFSIMISLYSYGQGNLPFEYLGIEYNGTIYQNDATINLCSQGNNTNYSFNAEYLPVGLSGDDYLVQPTPFVTYYPLNMENWLWPDTDGDGLPNNIEDDVWSPLYTLPFSFCYFGNNYTQVQVGTNGRITFNVPQSTDAGDEEWAIQTDEIMPNTAFLGNTIYGVYQDTDPTDGEVDQSNDDGDGITNVTYGVFGEEPFRAFVVSYSQMPLYGFGCDDFNTENPAMQTYQIILHEGTNAIDVIVWNRNSCTQWNRGLGVIAILNEDSSLAYVPPGRNTGTWDAEQEAWRFIPNGGEFGSANTITWDKNGQFASDDTTLITSITENTSITLNNEYLNSCTNESENASVTVNVELTKLTLDVGASINICPGDSKTLNVLEQYDSYKWYKDGELIPNESAGSLTITESGIYRVEYETENCTAYDEVDVTLIEDPNLTAFETTICDTGVEGEESVDVSQYYQQVLGGEDINDYNVAIYSSMVDAENEENALTNPVIVNSPNKVFYVRFNYKDTSCYWLSTIKIILQDQLKLTAVDYSLCSEGFEGTINLNQFKPQISELANLSYSFYTSEADAQNNVNPISESSVANYPISQNVVIYVKAENSLNCKAFTTISINFSPSPVVSVEIDGNDATVNATEGVTPYEYSIDGGNTWTTENVFNDLVSGKYTALVRSNLGCIGMKDFEVFEIDFIPSVITPNGDGINDTWVIKGIQYFPGTSVKLYDRYGKLFLDKITDATTDVVWDGNYLNDHLPSTTYWYFIKLPDGKELRGYLVVKNRYKKEKNW